MSLAAGEGGGAWVSEPAGVLAVLLVVLAAVFRAASHPVLGRALQIVPPIVLCYFIPMFLAVAGVIPSSSALYTWVIDYVLPGSLVLLTLSLDVPGIMRLGPRAVAMLGAGTAGVVLGGPVALLVYQRWLPEDAWRGMAALAGSWIGGGANMMAIARSVQTPEAILSIMIVVDTVVAGVWMGILLALSRREEQVDRWLRADASVIRSLEQRLAAAQAAGQRLPTLADLMVILALAFGGSVGCHALASRLPDIGEIVRHFTWTVILVTALGVIASFTPLRRYEGAGASRVGSVMLYLLVACIGARADLSAMAGNVLFVAMGFTWMAVHALFMLVAARLVRAPLFLMAVGSQANIGGAASAPAVAAAFHPALAPVGVLLAVAGYVLGTYAALVCAAMLRAVAGT